MKIILLQDVAKIGKRSQIVEVPDGYAMNQLIPKKLAEPATPANIKRVKKIQDELKNAQSADQERFEKVSNELSGKVVKVNADINEQGHLFKAVSPEEIAAAADEVGVEVDPALIVINEPIKSAGEHTVSLMRGEQKNQFTIEVVKKA